MPFSRFPLMPAAVTAAGLAALPSLLPAQQAGLHTCTHELALLPAASRLALAASNAPMAKAAADHSAREQDHGLTAIHIDYDLLGAVQDVPWRVHREINVRSGPGILFEDIGTLQPDDTYSAAFYRIEESNEDWLQIDFQGRPAWISSIGVYHPHPHNVENARKHGNLPLGEERVNRWWANESDYEPNDLVDIPTEWTTGRDNYIYQLRAEAAEALVEMFKAAREDGIELRAGSCYRSWPTQKRIYDRATTRSGLDQRYSAPPGHSEHQLGTTCDISYAHDHDFLDAGTPEHEWMKANGHRFGFRQTYTPDNIQQTGYIAEPWHWRYFGEALEQVPGTLVE